MDGGLQARFAEMGVMGFAGYIAALLLALMFTLQRWWEARQSGDDAASDMLAAALAVQTALIAMDLSVDAHVNIIGALFWITVGISLTGSGAVVRVHDKDVNSSYARSPA
jgi:hypothetical protein